MVWSRKRKTFFLLSGILGVLLVALANFSPFLSVIAAEPKVIPPITARQAQATAGCTKKSASSSRYQVTGNANTVQWGFFSKKSPPVLAVQSKDYVTMDLITHHAGDDYARMIQGDPGIESIYRWTATEKGVSDRGPGVHILTGPVYVCDAEPGDLLEVRIVDLKLKPSGNPRYPGKTFGSNAAGWWFSLQKPVPRTKATGSRHDLRNGFDWQTTVGNSGL